MMVSRRFLPSISSLLALDAVDRLGSATAAAEELSLTHSAVSRQIKVMEGQLGLALVNRDGVRLRLTPAAREYCQAVRACLQDLSHAALKLKANPQGGSLNLAILPAYGMHWLAPRLRDFRAHDPEIMVNLMTRLEPFDFARENFDAALHFGHRDWQGVHYLPLSNEYMLPVCAPDLLDSPLATAEEIRGFPLLHLESRPRSWEDWFDYHGCGSEGLHGMLFDQFSTLTQAAIQGFGVALLPDYLAEEEIRQGRLVRAFGDAILAQGRYYLVWANAAPPGPVLATFINWLTQILPEEART